MRFKKLFFPLFVISLLLISLIFFLLLFWPITVLKNWSLIVPSGNYYPGDTVEVHSQSTKIRAAVPLAHRNIECKNSSGMYVSYHLADVQGVNNSVGHHSSQIPFIIPDTIPNLPTTCRFSIDVEYQLYPFRTINQYTASNTFKLENLPSPVISDIQSLSPSVIQVNQVAPLVPSPLTEVTSNPSAPAPVTKNCAVDLLGIHLLC